MRLKSRRFAGVALATAAGLLSLLQACGGGSAAANPDCDISGHACTWAGLPGQEGFNGDGLHRLSTKIYWSMDMVFEADGTPWFIDWNNHLVRKVLADGTVRTIVGWIDPVFPGDGEPSGAESTASGADGTLVQLNHPTDFALQADGSILLMAWHNHKLRRIDPLTGKVRILAGADAGFAGDGSAAAAARFKQPSSVQLDPAGNVYIVDQQSFRIRKIGASDGLTSTFAGVGTQGSSGDGGPASAAQFNWEFGSNPEPSGGLALANGKLYVADTLSHRVRVIDLATNRIDALAGTGTGAYSGDGGLASAAALNKPHDLEIGPEGDLYIADTDNHCIRAMSLTTGIIRTVAGTGTGALDLEEGKLATETSLNRPFGIEFDAAGNLYISDTINSRIVRVAR